MKYKLILIMLSIFSSSSFTKKGGFIYKYTQTRMFSKKGGVNGVNGGVIVNGGVNGGGGGGGISKYTENQKMYIDALTDPKIDIVIVMGSAGTGKTVIGCQTGLIGFLSGKYKKMVITRPLIPVSGEELGFIPGTILNKMQPWIRPIYDALLEKDIGLITKSILDKHIISEDIEISPLAFMRGRTFTNSFIFADEMQNSTPEQMLMLLTRIGRNSKLVISGDLAQSDVGGSISSYGNSNGNSNSRNYDGLYDFIIKWSKWSNAEDGHNDKSRIKVIQFKKDDICRSEIITTILDIYGKE